MEFDTFPERTKGTISELEPLPRNQSQSVHVCGIHGVQWCYWT